MRKKHGEYSIADITLAGRKLLKQRYQQGERAGQLEKEFGLKKGTIKNLAYREDWRRSANRFRPAGQFVPNNPYAVYRMMRSIDSKHAIRDFMRTMISYYLEIINVKRLSDQVIPPPKKIARPKPTTRNKYPQPVKQTPLTRPEKKTEQVASQTATEPEANAKNARLKTEKKAAKPRRSGAKAAGGGRSKTAKQAPTKATAKTAKDTKTHKKKEKKNRV